jgi:hypothetical protein
VTTVKGTLWFNPNNAPQALSPNTAPAPGPGISAPFVPQPPCARGYLIVWAVDNLGRPISFNGLIGNALLRNTPDDVSAYEALPIQAVAAVQPGEVIGTDPNAPLAFDERQYAHIYGNIWGTVRYERLGQQPGDIQTDLTLLTLDVRVNAPNLVTFVPLNFYNENERPISTFKEFICWSETRLRDLSPSLTENFGGLGARKGLVESTQGATQQNTEHPFETFPATLVGIVETKERAGIAPRARIVRSYSYWLFHDDNGVETNFCLDPGSPCPR